MTLLGFPILLLVKLLFAAFNGILFTQSGLDKVFHYQGNLDYFKDHFKKSPLASSIGLLMPVITLLETSAGLISLAGLVLEIAGVIPTTAQVVPCGDFEFTVLEVERNRINKIKVTIKPQLAE